MAKKNKRRNNQLKKATSTAAKVPDTVTSARIRIEERWFPIFNSQDHPLITHLFKQEDRKGDFSGCIPMLFDHGSNNETPDTTNAIPTWVVLTYDHGEDAFFAKVLDLDRYACHPELDPRQLFTLEEVVFSDQRLWLWFWLKEEDFWEKDELLWEEEFRLDGADMRRRKQECLRLMQIGELNTAWEIGKGMARELLFAAGREHEVDDEWYWDIDETTGRRKLPAEANIPDMAKRFGNQRHFYTLCDYRNRGVPEAERQTDFLVARGANDEDCDESEGDDDDNENEEDGDFDKNEEDGDFDKNVEDGDYDKNEEDEELETRATADRTCSTANESNCLVQQQSSGDGSETHSEGETDEDNHAAEELLSKLRRAPGVEHEASESARCEPPRGFFSHTRDKKLRDMTPFIIQFPLPDDFGVSDKGDEPSIPAEKSKTKNRKRKKKGKNTTQEQKGESEDKEIPDGTIDNGESHNSAIVQPEQEPAATTPKKKKKKKPKKKPMPQPPADAITSFTTVTTKPLPISTTSPTEPTMTTNTSTPAHDASSPSSSSSSYCSFFSDSHIDATNANTIAAQIRNLDRLTRDNTPHKWTTVAMLGYRETLNMALAIRDKYGVETVRRAVVLYATGAGWALV